MKPGKKILVTGADGFIGSHLTEFLIARGYDVRAFVFYNSFNSWGWLDYLPAEIHRNLDVFTGDIRDANGVRSAAKDCDAIMHLAALIGIPFSYHSPATYIETNINGTLNVVQAARDLGVQKVIHTSTSEVYGTAQFVPITEDHPLQGQSPYSASKIGADQIALSYYRSFETPVSVIRPFNTYGPRQSARAVIPTIITQLLAGAKSINLGAVSPTRDFNYVSDTVAAFVALLEADGVAGETINIGSNFEISVEDTANLIADIIGCPLKIETDTRRVRPEKSEVERLWASNEKARRLLGWKPEHGGLAGFRNGIAKTVEWFRSPQIQALYKPGHYNI